MVTGSQGQITEGLGLTVKRRHGQKHGQRPQKGSEQEKTQSDVFLKIALCFDT
ncbi:hypothetical protein P7K49_027927, partial [Saguinus oedipus]